MEYIFYLTNDCNLNCKYCYEGEKSKGIMNFEIIRDVMNKECESQDNVSQIAFFGGEPLLQEKMIYDTVNLGKELTQKTNHKFIYTITTNATMITDKFVDFCKENSITVGLSIDGDKNVHNLNRIKRNGEGSFEQVIKNVKKCLKADLNPMALPVVCLNNVKYLSESVKYLIKLGFKNITLNTNYTEAWDDDSISVMRKEYEKLANIYCDEYKKGNYINIYPLATKMYYGIHKNEKCSGSCNGSRIAINTDGKFYPCVQFVNDDRFVIGNYKDGIDKEKSDELIKRRLSSKSVCEECALKRRCLYDCGCTRLSTTNDIVEVTPLICETERIFIEIADKIGNKLYQDFKC